ncbi:Crp/Fnr family transcriptional regulator [Desulfocarbo indianensis]|nr:Crp/Fnr family transcriptional regulator [Desulfocarbo indianensis]
MASCKCEELAGPGLELSPTCLGHLWLFQDLEAGDLEALSQAAQRRKYGAGELIFRQGDPADTMFLIKGGRAKLTKLGEDGSEFTLDIRKAGDFLGENMLNDPGDLPVSAVCLEDSLTCGFSREDFEKLVLAHPRLGLQVIKNLSRRIDWLFSRVGSLSLTNLEERLYQVLVNVAREHGIPEKKGLVIAMPFTHEELSFLAGAHRVSITRAMKGLKASGRVLQEGKRLIVAVEAGAAS